MKKHLLLLFSFLPLLLFAQTYLPDNTYGKIMNRVNVRQLQGIPKDTFAIPDAYINDPHIAAIGSTLYVHTAVSPFWQPYRPGGNAGGALDSIQTLFVVDLAQFYLSTNADGVDTLHALPPADMATQTWVDANFLREVPNTNYFDVDLLQSGRRVHDANGYSEFRVNGDTLEYNYNHYRFGGVGYGAADSIYGKDADGNLVLIPVPVAGDGGTGTEQVNADWTATEGAAMILNKPTKLSDFTNDLNLAGQNIANANLTLDDYHTVDIANKSLEFQNFDAGGNQNFQFSLGRNGAEGYFRVDMTNNDGSRIYSDYKTGVFESNSATGDYVGRTTVLPNNVQIEALDFTNVLPFSRFKVEQGGAYSLWNLPPAPSGVDRVIVYKDTTDINGDHFGRLTYKNITDLGADGNSIITGGEILDNNIVLHQTGTPDVSIDVSALANAGETYNSSDTLTDDRIVYGDDWSLTFEAVNRFSMSATRYLFAPRTDGTGLNFILNQLPSVTDNSDASDSLLMADATGHVYKRDISALGRTLYAMDGTIESNRTVTGSNTDLVFNNFSGFQINNNPYNFMHVQTGQTQQQSGYLNSSTDFVFGSLTYGTNGNEMDYAFYNSGEKHRTIKQDQTGIHLTTSVGFQRGVHLYTDATFGMDIVNTGAGTDSLLVINNTTVKKIAASALGFSGGVTSESDPVFAASAAHGITNTNIGNWNTAYGWGNHATAGYLTSASIAGKTNNSDTAAMLAAYRTSTIAQAAQINSNTSNISANATAIAGKMDAPAHYVMTYSATPVLDYAPGGVKYQSQEITLTGNVTSSTYSNIPDGGFLALKVVEDATGGRTFALPTGTKVNGTLTTTGGAVNAIVIWRTGSTYQATIGLYQ